MKWLFLVHQIQTPNSRERVKVWRLTKKVGAQLYRNSVYVLPYSKERLEDFQWLCQEIRHSQGDASVFVSEAHDAKEDRALKALFCNAREKDYNELQARINAFEDRANGILNLQAPTVAHLKLLDREVKQLEDGLRDVRRVDFFENALARPLQQRLRRIRLSILSIQPENPSRPRITRHARKDFQGKTWATRPHIHIDRICSAWLIRRFIDTKARFVFAPEDRLPKTAIHFDTMGAEFSHQGDHCTFETLLEAFGINDKALRSIAELVHTIDLKDQKFNPPEAAGVDLIVRSLSDTLRDDAKALELGSRLLDAVYAQLSSK